VTFLFQVEGKGGKESSAGLKKETDLLTSEKKRKDGKSPAERREGGRGPPFFCRRKERKNALRGKSEKRKKEGRDYAGEGEKGKRRRKVKQ